MDLFVKIPFFLFMIFNYVLSIRLDVNPKKIQTVISKNLLVNCSFSKGSVPKLNGLISLILARTLNTDQTHSTLASINAITGQVQVYTPLAVGYGTIDNKGDSYISLQWPYPMDDMAGDYICEANGVDIAWRPTTVIEKVTVTAANLNVRLLRDGLRSLLISIDNLLLEVGIMKSRTEASKLWYFKSSEVYKGRRYYLSQQDPIGKSEQSMATCVQYGGYLAEIDDLDEMNFIKAFLKTLSGFRLVLIGGTDDSQEEVWKYRYSNKSVPSFLVRSRKCGRICSCLYLYDGIDWLANDDTCYYTHPNYPSRFLCEIPELKKAIYLV